MSTEAIETPAVDAPIDLDNLPDGRIEDKTRFQQAHDALIHAASRAVTEWQRATNAAKALAAARVNVRATLLLGASGLPDWGATSDAYRIVVSDAENGILAKLGADAKGRLQASVRQHVKRSMLLPGIVAYVLSHGSDAKLAAESERWGKDTDLVNLTSEQLAVLSDPSASLINAVRRHYKAAKLDIPAGPFQKEGDVQGGTGGGNPPSDPPSVLSTLDNALGGLGEIVPRFATLGLLRASSDVSQKIIGSQSDIENRPTVIEHLQRIAEIASLTAKVLDGKGNEQDAAKLAADYFDPESDKVD